jgi:multidrug efflux pump subunit AcrB
MPATSRGPAGRIAKLFIDSKLTPLFILAAILLGIGAVLLLPREEEPQIVVPMIDVFVEMSGVPAREIEERVTRPMEKLIWEIPGVEYVYSTSSPGLAMAVVRFRVGENEEDSIVRLNQKMAANLDRIPPGASQPLIKPRSIDDVPILAVTLASSEYDHFMWPLTVSLLRLLLRALSRRTRRSAPAAFHRTTLSMRSRRLLSSRVPKMWEIW